MGAIYNWDEAGKYVAVSSDAAYGVYRLRPGFEPGSITKRTPGSDIGTHIPGVEVEDFLRGTRVAEEHVPACCLPDGGEHAHSMGVERYWVATWPNGERQWRVVTVEATCDVCGERYAYACGCNCY